ncbi:hypothetical protein SNE40_010997 [Patella caerulea]|uniref:CSC1-like protein 2 n=1 Tax=Patella caerulea TaxID=87958 RepID=A0AAN8JZH0_PATCE
MSGIFPTVGPSKPFDSEVCNTRISNTNNHTETETLVLFPKYAGIPFNLVVNVVVFLILLILFTILRRLAWDYGRLALVSRAEEKWTSLFYGDNDKRNLHGSQESFDTSLHKQDKNLLSWIPAFYRVRDSDILHKCGRDAIQYLSFQRYLIIYVAIICVLSICVILPVNFQGNILGNATEFSHTTIGNVPTNSPLQWVHAVFSVIYLLIVVFIVRHFHVNLEFEEDEQVSRTLFISNIPKDRCFQNQLKEHFHEAYPEVSVDDIQFAYNITKLVQLDKKRERAAEAKLHSTNELSTSGTRPLMRPYPCGHLCGCDCCGCKQVDAMDYYTEKEERLTKQCEQEKVHAYQDPIGIAFVTFQSEVMAEKVRTDFRANCKGTHNPQTSGKYLELAVQDWEVKFAPAPDNVYWENLATPAWKWWLKAIIINSLLFILLFFLTTPVMLMNVMDSFDYTSKLDELHSPLLVQFLPTILLWTFSALLPNIVYYSDQYIGHWTKTGEHHVVMRKTFIFLLLMVLILPSLGLTSAKALFEWFVIEKGKSIRWQCMFLAGNGAFFVNYVITSAFIGSGLELIRFSELFTYTIRLMWARSAAERSAVRKSVLWDFQYGCQYAWMLCVFAITVSYSILCPLIVPFGLVYMIFKHIVDRYNIYFAYKASRINKHIHASAVNYVIISVILLQFTIVFFTVLRAANGLQEPVVLFSSVALFVTLIVLVGRICFGWFKHLSPSTYKQFGDREDSGNVVETGQKPFVANVLLDKPDQNNTAEEPRSASASYGAVGVSNASASINYDEAVSDES